MSSQTQPATENPQDEWTVGRVLDWTTGHLRKHVSETPRLDAEILLAHAKSCQRIQLYTNYTEVLSDEVRAAMRGLVTRRANSEPVAYLVGHREFYGIDFRVTPDVLIPRPDTETLVLELVTLAAKVSEPRILEIGTGSGCIAISTASNLKAAMICATDISAAALSIAAENAERNQCGERVQFLQGDLFAALETTEPFDFIVSNPPYVPDGELEELEADVRDHEPHLALAGGLDGTDIIKRLLTGAGDRLKSGGYLLLEIGAEQGNVLQELITATGDYETPRFLNDLAGRTRVVVARRS